MAEKRQDIMNYLHTARWCKKPYSLVVDIILSVCKEVSLSLICNLRPSLIEGECVENILPTSRCFADITTKMRHAVLVIPLDCPRSPFSISPNDDVIIIHYFDDNRFAIG